MFQFAGFAHLTVWYAFSIPGCPIRIFADHKICASPRNFSQLITSFFASESLGIRHTPLLNLLYFLPLNLIRERALLVLNIVLTFISKRLYLDSLRYHFYQYVNERYESQLINNLSILILQYTRDKLNYLQALPGGEYRSRTDDLLRARQAL